MNIHSISYLFLITTLVIFIFSSCTTHKSGKLTNNNEDLKVETYSASEKGFRSNSHLLLIGDSAVLVDAQFIPQDAENVVDLIHKSGKHLKAIIITHPHPDHYYGLEVIGKEFPGAMIYGGEETIGQIKNSSKYWEEKKGGIWTQDRFKILDSGNFTVSGLDIQYKVFKNSESIENMVLYIPSVKTLFIGDLASNNVHMWLTEGQSENWLVYLDQIKGIGPIDKVYPGHGPVSDQNIIDQAKEYINEVNMVIESSFSSEEAILMIKEKYPDYEMPQILEGTVFGLFDTNK